MNAISIPAHFDGVSIVLDKPYPLKLDAKLMITVLPDTEERDAWLALSAQRLAQAFADDEPEYPMASVREINPSFDRR
jgi:hypothetical protein